jgi:flagellar biogenesis protein FliO
MDVWNSIMQRVAEMNREDAQEAAREKDRAKNAKRRQSEIAEISLALGLIIVLFIFATWGLVEFINYCGSNACGK